MQSDAELVTTAVGGDPEAFAVLMRRHERSVRAAAVEVLGDHEAARDAAQETFLAAYRKLGELRNGSAFGPWVVKIARRRAGRMARQRRVTASLESQPDPVDARGDGHLDGTSRRLLSAVMSLPRHERAVVMLRHFDGLSVQVVAEMTGRPVGTVTKQLSRAYARLRQRLKDEEP